jgi:hypothetical protein
LFSFVYHSSTKNQMLKKLLFLLLLPVAAGAQSLSPTVIASSGTTFTSASASMDFTVGEVAITTLSTGNNILTQGFHQPLQAGSGINDEYNWETGISLYPNPVSDNLTIIFNGHLSAPCNMTLCDMTGKALARYENIRPETLNALEISMQGYSQGMYFLRIQSLDGVRSSTNKIIKTANQ